MYELVCEAESERERALSQQATLNRHEDETSL